LTWGPLYNDYDFSQTLNISIEELTGIEDQVVPRGIRTIEEMGRYIKNFYSDNLFGIDQKRPPFPEIVDKELQFIDEILDNLIINTLISPEGYSVNHRQIQSYQLFRMELLKVIKYPEISYRKFCTDDYFGKEQKQNRRFVRLPLNTKKTDRSYRALPFQRNKSFFRVEWEKYNGKVIV